MPGNSKKTPISNTRKRVTASARARVSTKKVKRNVIHNSDGSYLQDQPHKAVSTVTSSNSTSPVASNDNIVALLQQLNDSNKALTDRIDKIEEKVSRSPTTLLPRSHCDAMPHPTHPTLPQGHVSSTPGIRFDMQGHRTHGDGTGVELNSVPTLGDQPCSGMTRNSTLAGVVPLGTQTGVQQQEMLGGGDRRDAILPNLEELRRNDTVADSVNQLLAFYEQKSRQEVLQGKGSSIKKSGRYSTIEMVTATPQARWPNEGCHGMNGKKRPVYDDLTMAQWVSGQLTNVYNIQDPTLLKQVLLQVIMATRDATTLPWQAVRNAWATSMHQIEEGSLQWSDTTQWSLNHISASQLAMTNFQTTSQTKKTCKYFNEDKCTHESSHGNYMHVCLYCSKQGRQLTHPESKCSFKFRGNSRPQGNNS